MRRLEVLAVVLVCGLAVSLIVNVVVLTEILELRHSYDQLRQSYDELVGEEHEPPVSKSQAIEIALEYGGWNETSLEGMEVETTLNYYCIDGGITRLHQVTGHIVDYRSRSIGDATLRYLWVVTVSKKGGPCSIPPPGLYYVDPIGGRVASHYDIMRGKMP